MNDLNKKKIILTASDLLKDSMAVSTHAYEEKLTKYFAPLPEGGLLLKEGAGTPDLNESLTLFNYLFKVPATANIIADMFTWALGDFINITESFHGAAYFSAICEQTERNEKTLLTTATICKNYKANQRLGPPLTFSHYKEVFFTKGLGHDERLTLLSIAHDNSLSVRQLRVMAKWTAREEGNLAETSLQALEPPEPETDPETGEVIDTTEKPVKFLIVGRTGVVTPTTELSVHDWNESRTVFAVSKVKLVADYDGITTTLSPIEPDQDLS